MNIGKICGICSCCERTVYHSDPVILVSRVGKEKPIFDKCDDCYKERQIWENTKLSSGYTRKKLIAQWSWDVFEENFKK